MKTAAKVLIGFAVVIALVLAGGYWFLSTQASNIAQSTVSSATGNDALGDLAAKVMAGEDLTDAEIQSALGVDDATYKKIKKTASNAGIDLNDSSQLRDIAVKNAGNIGEVESIVNDVKSGSLSEKEAEKKLKELVQK